MTSNSIKQEKKLNIELKNISKETTLDIIREHHYSNTLASINKEFLGIYINGELEGCITLGYGTRPKHTIKRMFPSLDTKNYLEIGRLCVSENYGNNTESQILSRVVKHLKKDHKEVKVLFTWANGMYGKPGFVYQASNFLYGGYIMSELYLVDGVQVHPRRIKQLISPNDKRKTIRPSPEQKYEYGIEHYKGKLFRYIYFLCGFSENICISYISTDGATKETTKQVFIEGADLCQTCYYYDDDYCLAYEDNPDKVTECYMYEREECL